MLTLLPPQSPITLYKSRSEVQDPQQKLSSPDNPVLSDPGDTNIFGYSGDQLIIAKGHHDFKNILSTNSQICQSSLSCSLHTRTLEHKAGKDHYPLSQL